MVPSQLAWDDGPSGIVAVCLTHGIKSRDGIKASQASKRSGATCFLEYSPSAERGG